MKKTLKAVSIIICIAIILSLTACGAKTKPTSFDDFTLQVFKNLVSSDGFSLSFSVASKEKYGLEDVPVTWGEAGTEAIRSNEVMIKDVMKQLSEYDPNTLTQDQRLTYDVMVDYFSTASRFIGYEYYLSDFTPIEGFQQNILTNFVEFPFRDKQHVEDYLALVLQFGEYVDKLLAFETERVNKGYGMSDYAIDNTVKQCNAFIEPKENSLVAVFTEKLAEVSNLTEQEKSDLTARNKKAVEDVIIPAYERIIEQLNQHKGKAKVTGGLCNYEGGQELYENIIKQKVGSEKTVMEIADSIDKSIQAAWTVQFDIMNKDPDVINRYMSFKKSIQPEQAIATLKEKIKQEYPEYPEIDASIKPIYKSVQQPNIMGYWLIPPVDDITHSTIRYNDSAVTADNGVEMFILMAHEGYPGHLYQNAVFNELSNPPEIRSVMSYTGYGEGWAKYVEDDAYAMMGITDENLIAVIQIQEMLNMAYVCRVDIGMNYEGWTLDDAANFLQVITEDRTVVELICNQVVSDPATFMPYHAGKLEMQELEDMAREALGEKFDIKEFREVVLRVGQSPYSIVEERLQTYIASMN